MASLEKILAEMRTSRNNVKFFECLKVCTYYFGSPSIKGSHHCFRTPWKGEPWVNIQNKKGYVIGYQVKQILDAIDKLEGESRV